MDEEHKLIINVVVVCFFLIIILLVTNNVKLNRINENFECGTLNTISSAKDFCLERHSTFMYFTQGRNTIICEDYDNIYYYTFAFTLDDIIDKWG